MRVLFLLLFLSLCTIAAANPYYSVTFSASFSTEVSSGTNLVAHTIHISNKTITDAIIATGTSGVLKASDLALVVNGLTTGIEVIDTSNENIIAQIAYLGGNSNAYALTTRSKGNNISVIASTNHLISIPGMPTLDTNWIIKSTVNSKGQLSSSFTSFAGGDSVGDPGSHFIQGTVRRAGKVFP